MPRQLTTAEALLLEVLVAHKLLGAQHSTLDRRLWVRPQLEALRELLLVDWTYDQDANFRVVATEQLMSNAEAMAIADRLRAGVPADIPNAGAPAAQVGAR